MNPSGPHLAMAVLCQNVLIEKDNVVSVIRVVDRVTQSAVGPDAPETMPPLGIQLMAMIMLKAGSARGSFTVRLRPEDPRGVQLPPHELPVHLEGEDRGANLRINF